MRLLVIGAGMMGSSAAYDMARSQGVASVTIADLDAKLANATAERVRKLAGKGAPISAVKLNASDTAAAERLMKRHDGTLSCVPYFFNLGLAQAAVKAGCHFADLGGNNVVVRKTLALADKAERKNVALAPDCGLSPGMASILAGDLFRRLSASLASDGAKRSGKKPVIDALRLYVGGLPLDPKPPFRYQLVFSVEGLINEYVEPARVLQNGKLTVIEPLTEPEPFHIDGFPELVGFHTSGGTSTMPETFEGKVGECFEKTLRYPEHFPFIRGLYDLGLLSSEPRLTRDHKGNKVKLAPRKLTSELMLERFASNAPDVTVMRIEGQAGAKKMSFEMVDRYDPRTKLTSMMRTTAWPASVVLQMIVNGTIAKRGGVLQEIDVPAEQFISEMRDRGVELTFRQS